MGHRRVSSSAYGPHGLGGLCGPSWEVAPHLLGWRLTHTTPEGTVTVRLTEVEAYAGQDDPASHAFRGPTPRTTIMFGRAGRLYVYRSYGVHWALNVVTGAEGTASAVLLRAGEVIENLGLARQRRGENVGDRALARGPGNLARALGVVGGDLLAGGPLRLRPGARQTGVIASGPRVGVTKAPDVAWRFWIDGDPTVSAYRRSPRIP
jgi:DNA-3-methyladenine glycosylase